MEQKTKQEWSNPTPAGLVALAVACACFFGLLTGKVEPSAMPLIGCWLIGGFVVQLVVGLLDLKSGNSAGGNTFLFFSAFFMLVGGIEMFLKYNAIELGGLDTRIDGYSWAILTLALWLWSPAFFKNFGLLSIIVVLLDIALPIITLLDLQIVSGAVYSNIAAYSLLFAGIVGVYLSAAIVVNTAYGKIVYPLPGQKK